MLIPANIHSFVGRRRAGSSISSGPLTPPSPATGERGKDNGKTKGSSAMGWRSYNNNQMQRRWILDYKCRG